MESSPPTKRCSRCTQHKPHDAFYRRKTRRDGFHPWCRSCCADALRVRRAANPEKFEERWLSYYAANKKRIVQRVTEWVSKNLDKTHGYKKKYYLKNKEKLQQRARERKRQNPEHTRAVNWKSDLKIKYGMTPADYAALYRAQGGVCAVCARLPDNHGRLNVDHDHETKAVRQLLCNGCNSALGYVFDDPERLRKLAEYIERHRKLREERAAESNLIQFPLVPR